MHWNRHISLAGTHAFLSPSNYHWVNYSDDKLAAAFGRMQAAKRGSDLHAFAHEAIRLGVRLPTRRTTVNLYVNDGIGYRMTPEQTLFYSPNCYGHADTIAFRRNILRIHDLKTGEVVASEHQLEVYAALFCLEYGVSPFSITIELRLYQLDEVRVFEPDPDVIIHIMDRIKTFDKMINQWREEAAQ